MFNYIKKIYDLLYSPIITPYNLLENAKLENYSYVNYYKGKQGLIAEMKCITDDNIEAIFYYHFDSEDKLLRVYMETDSETSIVFDRENELKEIKNEYLNRLKNNTASKAI